MRQHRWSSLRSLRAARSLASSNRRVRSSTRCVSCVEDTKLSTNKPHTLSALAFCRRLQWTHPCLYTSSLLPELRAQLQQRPPAPVRRSRAPAPASTRFSASAPEARPQMRTKSPMMPMPMPRRRMRPMGVKMRMMMLVRMMPPRPPRPRRPARSMAPRVSSLPAKLMMRQPMRSRTAVPPAPPPAHPRCRGCRRRRRRGRR